MSSKLTSLSLPVTASTAAAQGISSLTSTLSTISSTTVSTATSVAAGAIAQQQQGPKNKDGQEQKSKAEYNPLRAQLETEQARRAREAQKAQQKRFYFSSADDARSRSSIVQAATGFPTVDLIQSLKAQCLKFQHLSSIFGAYRLGHFTVDGVEEYLKRPISRGMGSFVEIFTKHVQPIPLPSTPHPLNLTATLTGVTAKNTERSRLHFTCTPKATVRPPCDIVIVNNHINSVNLLALSLFDQLNSHDRVACIHEDSLQGGINYCLFPFTQTTEKAKPALRSRMTQIEKIKGSCPMVFSVVKGILSAFEELDRIDSGAHRARIVVYLFSYSQMAIAQEMWRPTDAYRSPVTPVFYFSEFVPNEIATLRLLGCCPLEYSNSDHFLLDGKPFLDLGRLARFSFPYACRITQTQLTIQPKAPSLLSRLGRVLSLVKPDPKGLQAHDIVCLGNGSLRLESGSEGITVNGISVGQYCRLDLPFSFEVDLEQLPSALSLQVQAEGCGPWAVNPLKIQFQWKPEISLTLAFSPFRQYLEGIERILYQGDRNAFRRQEREIELLMEEIPARHVVLLNSLTHILQLIDGFYVLLKKIRVDDPHAQPKIKKLMIELKKAIGEAIISEYDYAQLHPYIQMVGLAAEEAEKQGMLWRGTAKSLESRLKENPMDHRVKNVLQNTIGLLGINRPIQRTILSYLFNSHVTGRYFLFEGVKNGLLCKGTLNCSQEGWKERVRVNEIEMDRYQFMSMTFAAFHLFPNLSDLEQPNRWQKRVEDIVTGLKSDYPVQQIPVESPWYKRAFSRK